MFQYLFFDKIEKFEIKKANYHYIVVATNIVL